MKKLLHIKNIRKEIILFSLLFIIGFLTFYFSPDLPIYTKLSIIALILPSAFFLFREGEKFNKKKLLIILIFSILITTLWDSIAINTGIWDFPKNAVSFWIFGIPLEEYIFGFALIIWVLGIYTSLPHFKHGIIKEPHFSETPLLLMVFLLQGVVFLFVFLSGAISYIKWLFILAIIPSIFYLFRKRERIDEIRLIFTCLLIVIVTFIGDFVFIKNATWFYNETALLGRIGYIPIDDVLFAIFNSIVIVGFYTSLPSKNILTEKW